MSWKYPLFKDTENDASKAKGNRETIHTWMKRIWSESRRLVKKSLGIKSDPKTTRQRTSWFDSDVKEMQKTILVQGKPRRNSTIQEVATKHRSNH